MVWTGHVLGIVLISFALWWLVEHISGMPDYKLVVALAAMTGFVFNHFRWWRLGRKVNVTDIFEQINVLIVSNYVVLLLILMLVDIRR
jgi:hypothetical protein